MVRYYLVTNTREFSIQCELDLFSELAVEFFGYPKQDNTIIVFALAVGKGFKIIGVRCEGSIWKDNITNSWFLNPMGVDLVPLRFLRNSLDNRNKINQIKEFTERIFNIGTSLCYLRAVLLESSKFIIFLKICPPPPQNSRFRSLVLC